MAPALLRVSSPQQRGHFAENLCGSATELSLEQLPIIFQKFEVDLIFLNRPGPRGSAFLCSLSPPVVLSVYDVVLIAILASPDTFTAHKV